MVDRAARDIGVKTLRDFVSGRTTNDEFVANFPRGEDPGLYGIYYYVWGLFSDLRVHRLTGRDAPSAYDQARLGRCCLFLESDLEFGWPQPPSTLRALLMIVGLGRWFRPSDEKYKATGDFEVWPFLRKKDYEALRRAANVQTLDS